MAADGDAVEQRLHFGKGERIALQRHGVVDDAFENLAHAEAGAAPIRRLAGRPGAGRVAEAKVVFGERHVGRLSAREAFTKRIVAVSRWQ